MACLLQCFYTNFCWAADEDEPHIDRPAPRPFTAAWVGHEAGRGQCGTGGCWAAFVLLGAIFVSFGLSTYSLGCVGNYSPDVTQECMALAKKSCSCKPDGTCDEGFWKITNKMGYTIKTQYRWSCDSALLGARATEASGPCVADARTYRTCTSQRTSYVGDLATGALFILVGLVQLGKQAQHRYTDLGPAAYSVPCCRLVRSIVLNWYADERAYRDLPVLLLIVGLSAYTSVWPDAYDAGGQYWWWLFYPALLLLPLRNPVWSCLEDSIAINGDTKGANLAWVLTFAVAVWLAAGGGRQLSSIQSGCSAYVNGTCNYICTLCRLGPGDVHEGYPTDVPPRVPSQGWSQGLLPEAQACEGRRRDGDFCFPGGAVYYNVGLGAVAVMAGVGTAGWAALRFYHTCKLIVLKYDVRAVADAPGLFEPVAPPVPKQYMKIQMAAAKKNPDYINQPTPVVAISL
jgi:hypothetical protein